VIWTRTNNAGNESKLYVRDVNDNIVFSRTNFQNNTLHKDTINLQTGCYELELEDTGQDGLEFFANNDGTGFLQIRKQSGAPLAGFESNFGKNIRHSFTVGYGLYFGEKVPIAEFKCYPNPAKQFLNIQTNGFVNEVNIKIYNSLGKVVYIDFWKFQKFKNKKTIDISNLAHGIYFIELSDFFNIKTKQFFH
jgi:hypothetical protein